MRLSTQALVPSFVLENEYEIRSVLGQGGFAITYLAHSRTLANAVAIKEYFPFGLATRTAATAIEPTSESTVRDFDWGKDRFFREMQLLAQLRHPSIVRVSRCFMANNTAYAVLDYEEGPTLKELLAARSDFLSQSEVDTLLGPLLGALEMLHLKRLLHRDISPDNIIVRPDGTPVLIDFGAAKDLLSGQVKSTRAMVKRGYSPIEQYQSSGDGQGPPTDIYALAATIYECITGRVPPESTQRALSDTMQPVSQSVASNFRPSFLRSLYAALSLMPEHRPQTVAEWRVDLLDGDATEAKGSLDQTVPRVPKTEVISAETRRQPARSDIPTASTERLPAEPAAPRPAGSRVAVRLAIAASAALVLLGAGLIYSALRPGHFEWSQAVLCSIGLPQCRAGSVSREFDSAGACIDRITSCDAAAKCVEAFAAANPDRQDLIAGLRSRSEAAKLQCESRIATPSAPTPPAPSELATPAAPLPRPPAGSSGKEDGVRKEAQLALAQYSSCLRDAPCNAAGCLAALDRRTDEDMRAASRNVINKEASAAEAACQGQREASAFAELGACGRSIACEFESECLPSYSSAIRMIGNVDRKVEIERLKADARSRCAAASR